MSYYPEGSTTISNETMDHFKRLLGLARAIETTNSSRPYPSKDASLKHQLSLLRERLKPLDRERPDWAIEFEEIAKGSEK